MSRIKRAKRESCSSSSSIYLDSDYKHKYETIFSDKNVISERFIDYETFPNYPISQCFSGNNMIKSFLHIQGPAPLVPVRLFYNHIHSCSPEDQCFQTFIEGKIHKITPDVIGNVLGLVRPTDAVPYPPTSEDDLIVSEEKFRNAVYLNEYLNMPCDNRNIKLKHLKPIISVLVRICQLNILPKGSNYQNTNLESVYLSLLLLHGYPVDLSYLIWHTMAFISPDRRLRSVPYGIIVGQLLSYLGHPFPADCLCADVPDPLDLKFLSRFRLPCDPQYIRDGPLYEPSSTGTSLSSPPPAASSDDQKDPSAEPSVSFDQVHLFSSIQSIQHTMEVVLSYSEQQHKELGQQREMIDRVARQQDCLTRVLAQGHDGPSNEPNVPPPPSVDDDVVVYHSELPLPNDSPTESSGEVVRLSKLIQSLGDTVEVILSRFKQQQEEFMRQKVTVDYLACHQDHLEQQFVQQQKMISKIAIQQDRFEQQHEEFLRQKKVVDRIGHRLDRLETIDCIAHQQDCLDRVPAPDHVIPADGDRAVKVETVPCYSTLDQPVEASQLCPVLHTPHPYPHQKKNLQAEVHLEHEICQKCGQFDDMGTEILIPCKMCKVPAKHRNCLDTAPKSDDEEPYWFCDGCTQKNCSSLHKFNYQPNQ
ncbi:hypothetical protein C5167_011235 [Papaver somniferum]|uniref:PHD-type domain-containing protein n=1 Tax=Papaver somniferum TaxID=3469 RepID=A0A4Y7K6B7_PAPSO|nr:uncharacterized protein LOC113289789 [Papaver somniferum]RZC67545.1 hypothetical protein C5167_011235 [Papaver somniferum]